MSESEYGRLAAQLTEVLIKLSALEEKLTTYSDIRDQVGRHELAIQRIDQNCLNVQNAKKNHTINWGAVWGTVIGGSLMLLIGSLFMKWGIK